MGTTEAAEELVLSPDRAGTLAQLFAAADDWK